MLDRRSVAAGEGASAPLELTSVYRNLGRVTTLEPGALDPIRAAMRQRFAHHARFSHFPIHGYCDACAEAAPPSHGHHHRH